MAYIITAEEFSVLIELLRAAVDSDTLTEDQKARMSWDPYDILLDMEPVVGQNKVRRVFVEELP